MMQTIFAILLIGFVIEVIGSVCVFVLMLLFDGSYVKRIKTRIEFDSYDYYTLPPIWPWLIYRFLKENGR